MADSPLSVIYTLSIGKKSPWSIVGDPDNP